MTRRSRRDTGIDVIGRAPWGTHFCQFYETQQDLIDILVPYFKAGLRDNEYCMWVTSPPLVKEEAEEALRDAVPGLDRYLEKGQIEIIPYDQWYVIDGVFDSDRVLDGWVARTEQAKARGFDGLRLTGNTFWLERNGWKRFAMYEEEVNNVIGNYAMMAICTYSLKRCSASEIVDVISNHQFALIKREGRWEIFESAEHKRLEAERKRTEASLRESEERYRMLFEHLSEGFALHEMLYDDSGKAVDYRFLAANPAFERLTGFKREEVIGRTVRGVIPNIEQSWIDAYAEVVRTGKPARFEQFAGALGRYYDVHAFRPDEGLFAVLFLDVTDRRRAEEEVKTVARFPGENPNPVLRIGNDGTILYANSASMKLLSRSGAAVGGRAPQFIRSLVEQALAKHSAITVDIPFTGRVWSFTVAPIIDSGYANLYASDVTERKQAEDALAESEKKYRTIIETANEGVWVVDAERRTTYVNERMAEMLGYTPKEMLGRPHSEFMDEEGQAISNRALQKRRAGEPESYEFRLLRKDGTPLWTWVSATPQFHENGEFAGSISMLTDITERKQAEEGLRRTKEEWERTFDSVPDLIAILDTKFRVVRANRAMAERLGVTPEECVGLRCYQVVHGTNKPPFFCPHARAIKDGHEHVEEVHEERLGGDFVVTTTPLRDARGQIVGTVHVARDVTERKRAEEALRQTDIDLKRAQSVGHIGSWRLDVQKDVLEWSDETYRIFGVPQGTAMTYEAFLDYVHPEDRVSVNQAWQTGLSGEPYDIDHRIVVGEEVKWVHEQAELEFDDQGNLLGGFGTCQDITARKTAEAERDRLLLELDTVIESVPLGLGIYDTNGRILRVNPAQLRISGYRTDQFPQPIEERFHEFTPQTIDGKALDADLVPVIRALKGEVVEGFVIRFTKPNGETVWASTGAAPLRNKDGEVVGAVGAVLDITDLRRLQEDLEKALAAKDDFLSMVSHEMRTPLTAVLGGASLLLAETPLDEEGRLEVISEIRESAGRLAATINNMLALARVEAGRTFQFERLGLQNAVNDLVSRHCERNKHRQVCVNVTGNIPDALASKEYFAHILSNLLENAEKYAPRNEPIEIVLARDGNELSVRVRDRGIGLEPEEAKNIFEPFYRSPRIASVSPGVGIGLAVSKRLVEAQGGRIWARRRKGGGSEFGFTLPIAAKSGRVPRTRAQSR